MGYSGNDLLSDLKSESNKGFFALGYVVGTTDILGISGFLGSCFKQPDGVTYAQKIDVVENYLERNPQDRHLEAEVLIFQAMSEAFGRYELDTDLTAPFCPD